MPDFCHAVSCHSFHFFTFEINPGPVSAASVLQLVLMEPRFRWFSLVHKTETCSTNVKWSVYKQLFHMKRMKKYRGAPANACFILKLFWGGFSEMRVKTRGEGGRSNNDCCNTLIAVCSLSTHSNAYHLRSCCFCGLSQEEMSSAILAKFSKVTNWKLLWFHFSAACPVECCPLCVTMPEGGDRFLLARGRCVSFPFRDNQLY